MNSTYASPYVQGSEWAWQLLDKGKIPSPLAIRNEAANRFNHQFSSDSEAYFDFVEAAEAAVRAYEDGMR